MDNQTPKTEPATERTPDRQNLQGQRVQAIDVRARALVEGDRSAHRRHTWLYEDLLN